MRDSGSWEYGQEIAATYDTHTDTAITAAKATKLVDVDSQAEYNQAYQQMVKYALEAHGLKDEASKAYKDMSAEAKAVVDALGTNLSQDEAWMDFELKRRGLSAFEEGGTYASTEAATYYSKKDADGKSALERWAEDNDIDPDEAIDLFLKINPQFMNTDAEIQ
jgi:predicted metal-dependent phosphoesterase TrpH